MLVLAPVSFALGVGVVPDSLEFTEIGQSKSFTVYNPNDFPIDFDVRGPYFDYDLIEGTINPGEKSKIIATLVEDVPSQTSVIMVETMPLSDEYKSIGMLPTIGIKSRISLGEEVNKDDFVDEKNVVFSSAEIIVIVMLGVAVLVVGLLPLIRKRKYFKKTRLRI